MNDTPAPQASLRPLDDRGCHTFRFEGNGGDYARLWLQCMALNILTIGFYVPWAKIRLQRYLYNHTYFANGRFDYHASPVALLRGRLLVLAVLLFFSLWSTSLFNFERMGYDGNYLLLLIALLLPWLTLQSARFRLANTSWNHLRLHFAANLADSWRVHLQAALPLVPGLLLIVPPVYLPSVESWLDTRLGDGHRELVGVGLLLLAQPWVSHIRHRFLADHHRLGTARLQRDDCLRRLYKVIVTDLLGWLAANFILLVYAMFIAWSVGAFYASFPALNGLLHQDTATRLWLYSTMLACLIFSIGYWRMMLARELQNHTSLLFNGKQYRVGSWMQGSKIWELHISNAFMLSSTLGLAWPWVKIRTLRYRLHHIGLYDDSDLAWLYTSAQEKHSAQGDEIVTVLGMELGW